MGWRNCDLSFGFSCTLTVTAARNVTAVFNLPVALQYVPLTPCRVVDTRLANGPFGGPAISGRNFSRLCDSRRARVPAFRRMPRHIR